MPKLSATQASKLVNRRHPEWVELQRHWRWLADSLEGGDRYSHADYLLDPVQDAMADAASRDQNWPNLFQYPTKGNGIDPLSGDAIGPVYGQISMRNLIPHLSETGTDGQDLYVMRRSRTPVPRLTERAVSRHIAKVFAKEIVREGPPQVEQWWANVDGRGASVDDWVQFDAGPLFLTLGMYDLLFDHPPAPDGAQVNSRADLRELGLDACVVKLTPPESTTWWVLERDGITYSEVVIFDRYGASDSGPLYWHWTDTDVRAYRSNGVEIEALARDHAFGRVPMVRCFDRRLMRTTHCGRSRYAGVADLQRAVYNLRSELTLGDVQQSHALLQGPEDYCQSGDAIPTGPGGILPMKRTQSGGYQAWSFVDPPKGAQSATRDHVQDYQDEADRDAALAKPAGQTTGSTVSQSGISKIADSEDGNKLLAAVSTALQRFETAAAKMALVVLTDGQAKPAVLDQIKVTYPRQFDLDSLSDVAQAIDNIQRATAQAGALPLTEAELLKRAAMLALPGLSPEKTEAILAEIDAFAAEAGRREEDKPTPAEMAAQMAAASNLKTPDVGNEPAADPSAAEPENEGKLDVD